VGRKAGLSDEKLRKVLGDDLSPFNDGERLVIELAPRQISPTISMRV
jgi:hypothetical protein